MSTTNDNAKQELGAIWMRTTSGGMNYYTGKITIDGKVISIVMFQNTRKEQGSKQPDWRIYLSDAKPQQAQAEAGANVKQNQPPQQPRPVAPQPRPVARPSNPTPQPQPQNIRPQQRVNNPVPQPDNNVSKTL